MTATTDNDREGRGALLTDRGWDIAGTRMDPKVQQLCVWCGPVALGLFLIGFWFVAGFVPPPSPDDSALEVARTYRDHTDAIRAGLSISMVAAALMAPFIAVISQQMKRIEGRYSPLASTQQGIGMAGLWLFFLPLALMQTAAFRTGRSPEMIQTLNDAAWIPFMGTFSLFTVQVLAIGICTLRDRDEKVFPRWVGYFNIWAGLLVFPALLIYYFKTGPFAWNGLLVFWLGLTILGAWYGVMVYALRQAIASQASDASAADAT